MYIVREKKRGDFLLRSQGAIRFTTILESKTPHTKLSKPNSYREGVYILSDDLTGENTDLLNLSNFKLELKA